jgi:hypothetical protein
MMYHSSWVPSIFTLVINMCVQPYVTIVFSEPLVAARTKARTALSQQEGLDAETATKLLQSVHIQEEVETIRNTKEETELLEDEIPVSPDLKTIACPDCDGETSACDRCGAFGHIQVPITFGCTAAPANTETGVKEHQTRSRSATNQAKANQPKPPAKERDPKPQKKQTAKASQPRGSTKTRSTTDASKSRANQDEVQTAPKEERKTASAEAPTSPTKKPMDNNDPAAVDTTEGAAKVETAEQPAAPPRSRYAPRTLGKQDPPPPGETEVSLSSDESYDSSDVSYSKYDPPVTNVISPSSMTVPSPSEDRR